MSEMSDLGRKEKTRNIFVRSETNGRENNEDSFQVFPLLPAAGGPRLVLLAIADGMGGHEHGEHVSREALRKVSMTLLEQLSIEPSVNQLGTPPVVDADRISDVLWGAVERANVHIQNMVRNNKWGKAGSTLVATVILGNTAIVVNLGDSPLFHYRTKGNELVKVTRDHTVTGVLLEAGMITPEMARYHEGRSRLEFFVGVEKLPRDVPLHRVQLEPGDLLLLCSDGVSGPLVPEQIRKILSAPNRDMNEMAVELLNASLATGETDNQTLILWQHLDREEGTTPTQLDIAGLSEPAQSSKTEDVERTLDKTEPVLPAAALVEETKLVPAVDVPFTETATKSEQVIKATPDRTPPEKARIDRVPTKSVKESAVTSLINIFRRPKRDSEMIDPKNPDDGDEAKE